MRMCIRPDIPRRMWHAWKAWRRDPTENGGESSWGIDSMTRVAAVEFWVPAWDCSDERRRSQQGTIWLSGWYLYSIWRTREAIEVKDIGGKATTRRCRYC